MDLDDISDDVQRAGAKAGEHPVVEWGARAGYAVSGVLHLLIGWLGLQLAFGSTPRDADQSGALAVLGASPLGGVLLVGSAVSLGLLAVWQVTEAIRSPKPFDRLKNAGKAIAYTSLGWGALELLSGARSSSAEDAQAVAATLLTVPFGQTLVAAVGLGVTAVGGYHVWSGATRRFLTHLVEHPPHAVVVAGQWGYLAKGLALMTAGALFVIAALRRQPDQARGLDGALTAFLDLPFGQYVLAAISVGFAAFAVFSFARAKMARI